MRYALCAFVAPGEPFGHRRSGCPNELCRDPLPDDPGNPALFQRVAPRGAMSCKGSLALGGARRKAEADGRAKPPVKGRGHDLLCRHDRWVRGRLPYVAGRCYKFFHVRPRAAAGDVLVLQHNSGRIGDDPFANPQAL